VDFAALMRASINRNFSYSSYENRVSEENSAGRTSQRRNYRQTRPHRGCVTVTPRGKWLFRIL